MSRTLSGNTTGQAARIEHQEFLERIRQKGQFDAEYKTALADLKALEPVVWESWYDDQEATTCGEMLPLIKARIAELKIKPRRPERTITYHPGNYVNWNSENAKELCAEFGVGL